MQAIRKQVVYILDSIWIKLCIIILLLISFLSI